MTIHDQLKNHRKNFTVKELKKEVVKVKKDFQVSKLRRANVEKVILNNHLLFKHFLEKNKVKKTKPNVKKPKPSVKKSNPSEKKPKSTTKDNNTNKQQIDMSIKLYINQLLDTLDEKAAGKKYPEFIDERYSGVTIQKNKSHYIIRDSNDLSNVLLRATADRKQVEDFLYNILK